LERSLIPEYEGLVESLPYDAAVRVSEAALSIKGYADIKAAAAAAWRARSSPAAGAATLERGSPRRSAAAYVQNHPLGRPYDAVNEVYFDDLADLRRRVVWFEGAKADPELFTESRLISVKEVVTRG
jgi:hypothetical protein